MDKKYNSNWIVAIGQGFSFEVTHEVKHVLWMYFAQVAVLVYKAKLAAADAERVEQVVASVAADQHRVAPVRVDRRLEETEDVLGERRRECWPAGNAGRLSRQFHPQASQASQNRSPIFRNFQIFLKIQF